MGGAGSLGHGVFIPMCICVLYLTLNSNVNHTIHIVSIRKKGSVISGTSSSSIFVPFVVVLNTCDASGGIFFGGGGRVVCGNTIKKQLGISLSFVQQITQLSLTL